MTQFSWHWGCDDIGDGGAASMTVDTMETIQRLLDNLTPATSGVIYWTDTTVLPFTGFVNASDDLLEPTNPSGNTVRIASGVGVVQGWLYANDSNVDFDVSTGPINSTNYIVLRRDRAAQTVRLAYIVAAAPAGTAVVTQDATTWEVIIATVTLDGSSNISTLTDSRSRVQTPTGTRILLETLTAGGAESILTSAQIPPLFTDLEVIVRIQASSDGDVQLRLNTTASGHTEQYFKIASGAVTAVNNTAQAFIQIGYTANNAASLLTNTFDLSRAIIRDYATPAPSASSSTVVEMQGATMGDGGAGASSGVRQLVGNGYFSPGTGVNIDTVSVLVSAGLYNAGSTVEIWGIN